MFFVDDKKTFHGFSSWYDKPNVSKRVMHHIHHYDLKKNVRIYIERTDALFIHGKEIPLEYLSKKPQKRRRRRRRRKLS